MKNAWKQGWIFILLMLGTHTLYAQYNHMSFHHLTQDDGISVGLCSFISTDSRGFVWLSTIDGLNRFDGENVKVYRPSMEDNRSLNGNIISSRLFEDTNGDLWFTSYNALHCYNWETDDFDVYQVLAPDNELRTADYFGFALDSDGGFWYRAGLAPDAFVHRFDIKTRKDSIVCPIRGLFQTLIPDQSGKPGFILSSEIMRVNGFDLLDLNTKEIQHFLDGPTGSVAHESWCESSQSVWIGYAKGYAHLNPQTGKLSLTTALNGKDLGNVWTVRPHSSDLLFVASTTRGLLAVNRYKNELVRSFVPDFDDPFSLQSEEIHDIHLDDFGNLWVSQWTYGLSYTNLLKNKFPSLKEMEGVFARQLLAGPNNTVWCDSRQGIFVYSDSGEFQFHIPNTLPILQRVGFLYFVGEENKGEQILVFSRKIISRNIRTGSLKTVLEMDKTIRWAVQLEDGQILLAVNQQLLVLKSGSRGGQLKPVAMSKVDAFRYVDVVFSKGDTVFVSDNWEKLYVFKYKNERLDLLETLTGLGAGRSMCYDKKKKLVWFAGTGGLMRIDSNLNARVLNYKTDGLTSETYYGILQGTDGALWLSGNNGLLKYFPEEQKAQRFVRSDGLLSKEFNLHSCHKSDDGRLWFGGTKGVQIFHPDSIKPVPIPPQTALLQVLINDGEADLSAQPMVLKELDLEHDRNTLSFSFVSLSYSDPRQRKFAYRMVGAESDWVISDRGFARYPKLRPGKYTFEVRSANADGVWQETPLQLPIVIQTPFYQTIWFYLICALAVVGLFFAWFQYRLNQALKLERMRVKISSDLHDDVGSMLSGLAMQSEILGLNAQGKDKDRLQRIAETSRNAMARMRDTVWAIDARKDRLENLIDRMREHAEECLTPKDVQFFIQVNGLENKLSLPSNIRQCIYLIYKEAITNITKHSNADRVRVVLSKKGKGLEMEICDNGKVEEKSYKPSGMGLSNMTMRAKQVHGDVRIETKDGFCILLNVPSLKVKE